MSKAFIAKSIQDSTGCTGVAANQAATDLVAAIVKELKKEGGFTLPSFGTFAVRQKGQRIGRNPKTGVEVPITPRTVLSFNASNILKGRVNGEAAGS